MLSSEFRRMSLATEGSAYFCELSRLEPSFGNVIRIARGEEQTLLFLLAPDISSNPDAAAADTSKHLRSVALALALGTLWGVC
jgi:hypothetical protein